MSIYNNMDMDRLIHHCIIICLISPISTAPGLSIFSLERWITADGCGMVMTIHSKMDHTIDGCNSIVQGGCAHLAVQYCT